MWQDSTIQIPVPKKQVTALSHARTYAKLTSRGDRGGKAATRPRARTWVQTADSQRRHGRRDGARRRYRPRSLRFGRSARPLEPRRGRGKEAQRQGARQAAARTHRLWSLEVEAFLSWRGKLCPLFPGPFHLLPFFLSHLPLTSDSTLTNLHT